jgi:two-component system nitrate/nitrite sensor histidine kinase NarQ
MSPKQIKWLILAIPTLSIGLWEYLRHTILLPYVSMELGNWLSPIIVFLVTIIFVHPLFQAYEKLQQALKQEKASTQLMVERERIARELHDGIAQTLFLSSVQVEKLKSIAPHAEWRELQHSLHHIQEYVRRSIHTLKTETKLSLSAQMNASIEQYRLDTRIPTAYQASFSDEHFTQKETWEIIACTNEALTNIRKHAHATKVMVSLVSSPESWLLAISDNGVGFRADQLENPNHFGLRMMRERATECGAIFSITHQSNQTIVRICKGRGSE